MVVVVVVVNVVVVVVRKEARACVFFNSFLILSVVSLCLINNNHYFIVKYILYSYCIYKERKGFQTFQKKEKNNDCANVLNSFFCVGRGLFIKLTLVIIMINKALI